ncbi:origin recognition complex subunit 4 [Lithohypha guttulata]|uniref:origin recognition complex subunit 4 n=1 Tax=Lithohypha guttulata TaxID=1690604 RepID=UPI002DDE55A5|nr:origin recognition complex subunit 4 [Lithohypha guttulata]KAK5105036.1 origin recognition complex subunit 4 [Lithohypha guttulata]
MSSDFDPSPRASKRRRTGRYGSQRTLLADPVPQIRHVSSQITTEENEDSVNLEGDQSDDNEVNTPSRSTRKSGNRSATSRRKANRVDNVDSHISEEDVLSRSDTPSTTRSLRVTRTRRSQQSPIDRNVADRKSEDVANGNNTNELNGESAADQNEDEHDGQGTPQPRSSGRQRRPPKRLLETMEQDKPTKRSGRSTTQTSREPTESAPASPALKGILTPSRKQKRGVRKSVIFDQDEKEIEEQLGFRDIETPAFKKLPKRATPHPKKSKAVEHNDATQSAMVEEEDQEEDHDDVLEDMLLDEPSATVPVPELPHTETFSTQSLVQNAPDLQAIKHIVLSRLTSSSLPSQPPAHLQSQYTQLHSLLKATIESSESNSVLLLGPHGVGKSLLLDLALSDLSSTYFNNFHTVHLNGFIQTDDRQALREIWRQLGHSRNLEERETEDIGASYADTMASLLSLLSHPDEMMDDDTETENNNRAQITTSKSIVFILDEFDLFTTHPRQTLLYNLFDIAQSRKAPIVVVGCSCRMDVIECLEKRVKSRFSHRWVLVPGCRTLGEWQEEVRRALVVGEEERARMGVVEQKCAEQWNVYIEATFLPSEDTQKLVRSHFYFTKSLPDLFMALYPSIAISQPPFSTRKATNDARMVATGAAQLTTRGPELSAPPSILAVLITLPVLHLSLLISMCRLETIHTLTTSNFNLVYTHYTELVQTSRLKQTAFGSVTHSGTLRQWGRETCRGAWEELGLWGMIVPVVGAREDDGGMRGGGAEVGDTRSWRSEVALEDVAWAIGQKFEDEGGFGGGAGEVLSKWCSEV